MAGTTLDLEGILQRDKLAVGIADNYASWSMFRNTWLDAKKELLNYVYATDTRTTSNSKLPWKNSTTLPKLCQIRDNLIANYMAALFPSSDWMTWEALDGDANERAKAEAIQAYMRHKNSVNGFENEILKMVMDFVDYGNCFYTAEWVYDVKKDEAGQEIINYIGPKPVRISPLDIVFNPIASSFENTPKIIRNIITIGELKRKADEEFATEEDKQRFEIAYNKAMNSRRTIGSFRQEDVVRDQRFTVDGFSNFWVYINSNSVEVLTLYGDFYDTENNIMYTDSIVEIIDRSYVLSIKKNPSWLGKKIIGHTGWRLRQDNLYAMGPLDNLVGMQYRIDHLENLKADVFDLIAYPVIKVKGEVEDFEWGPGERIFTGDEGDVTIMAPDTAALNADNQIQILEYKMEEMAGAPREAMGFRSPGEKTAYEVQRLENAALRLFQDKISRFERQCVEHVLNLELELAKRNMMTKEVIRSVDAETGAILFNNISREDITGVGRLRPNGAAHFARKATAIQNLTNFYNSAIGNDPQVRAHLSGQRIAEMINDLFDFEKFGIYQPFVRVEEEMQLQRLMQAAGEQLEVEAATPAGVVPGDEV